jgi:hypothetical protein
MDTARGELAEVLRAARTRGLDLEQIRRKLGLLERHADKRKLPYANVTARRWFRPNPPLAESEVGRFESEHRVQLCADYRKFLLEVGNGGAGGIFPLGCDSEGYSYEQAMEAWQDGSYRVYMHGGMSLDRPFPHLRAWLPETPESESAPEINERNDPQVAGSVRIYHCGCAIYNILVLTGTERGHVWCNSRADDRGDPHSPGFRRSRRSWRQPCGG